MRKVCIPSGSFLRENGSHLDRRGWEEFIQVGSQVGLLRVFVFNHRAVPLKWPRRKREKWSHNLLRKTQRGKQGICKIMWKVVCMGKGHFCSNTCVDYSAALAQRQGYLVSEDSGREVFGKWADEGFLGKMPRIHLRAPNKPLPQLLPKDYLSLWWKQRLRSVFFTPKTGCRSPTKEKIRGYQLNIFCSEVTPAFYISIQTQK